MNMIPTPAMQSELAYMHYRYPDGKLVPRDHLHRKALVLDTEIDKEVQNFFNSGGAGMFANPLEYCRMKTQTRLPYGSRKQAAAR
jgi:hypothetical protein